MRRRIKRIPICGTVLAALLRQGVVIPGADGGSCRIVEGLSMDASSVSIQVNGVELNKFDTLYLVVEDESFDEIGEGKEIPESYVIIECKRGLEVYGYVEEERT